MPVHKKLIERQRAMNEQARELGMPIPYPKVEPKKPKPKPSTPGVSKPSPSRRNI